MKQKQQGLTELKKKSMENLYCSNSKQSCEIKKDLAADLMGQEIEPKEDTFAEEEDSWVTAKEPAEAAKMDYPVINELERHVFNKEFKDQNIKTRLSNLESKTFGKPMIKKIYQPVLID